MNAHVLRYGDFCLSLELKIFESDIRFPSNTIMKVCVESGGFKGNSEFDIDIKEMPDFCSRLSEIYSSLKGTATVKEAFGDQYLAFEGDGKGHIYVCGLISSAGDFCQELKFENMIDQTVLKDFSKELSDAYKSYAIQKLPR